MNLLHLSNQRIGSNTTRNRPALAKVPVVSGHLLEVHKRSVHRLFVRAVLRVMVEIGVRGGHLAVVGGVLVEEGVGRRSSDGWVVRGDERGGGKHTCCDFVSTRSRGARIA